MRRYLLVAAAILTVMPMAHAQETQTPAQGPEASAPPPVRTAIPRSEAPRPAPEVRMPMPRVQQPAPESAQAPRVAVPRLERTPAPPIQRAAPQNQSAAAAAAADDQRRAVPRTRDRGDNAPVGQAVPRGEVRRDPTPPPSSSGGTWRGGGRTYSTRPQVYNNYFYSNPYYTYPQRYYPYGYGAFGLGYFYYNPYAWYPRYYGYSGYSGYAYPAYPTYGSPGYYNNYNNRSYSVFDIGELRLQVSPRYAQVFIDGYYAGEVDDYDGLFQGIKLESGPYHVELVAPGYETLAFDIRITPGQKMTYRGDLRRLP